VRQEEGLPQAEVFEVEGRQVPLRQGMIREWVGGGWREFPYGGDDPPMAWSRIVQAFLPS
jgi:hypothetical protein